MSVQGSIYAADITLQLTSAMRLRKLRGCTASQGLILRARHIVDRSPSRARKSSPQSRTSGDPLVEPPNQVLRMHTPALLAQWAIAVLRVSFEGVRSAVLQFLVCFISRPHCLHLPAIEVRNSGVLQRMRLFPCLGPPAERLE